MATRYHPVEAKVKAASTGAGVGAAVGGAVIWALDTYVHTPDVSGDLPEALVTLVLVGTSAAVSWAAGYMARHTWRPTPAASATRRPE